MSIKQNSRQFNSHTTGLKKKVMIELRVGQRYSYNIAGVHNSVLSSCLDRCRAGVNHSSSAVSSVC